MLELLKERVVINSVKFLAKIFSFSTSTEVEKEKDGYKITELITTRSLN